MASTTKGVIVVLKEISALKARQHLGELLEEVYYRNDHVVIKRRDKAMAVLIPVDVYEAWRAEREEDFKVFDEIHARNKDVDPEEVGRDVEAVSRGWRAKKYGQGRP